MSEQKDGSRPVESATALGPALGRREALRNIGALAGAAPAVVLLLAPSTARALGRGGSPCEGCGPAPGAPSNTGAPGGQDTGLLGKRQS